MGGLFNDDAELVWNLTESFTQEETAKAMGWNTRVDVARYKALKVLKDAGAWDEIVVPTFQNLGTTEENEEGTANVPTGTKTPFTERLLREILDLSADQQTRLCKWLVKGKDPKGHAFGKADFKTKAGWFRGGNALRATAKERPRHVARPTPEPTRHIALFSAAAPHAAAVYTEVVVANRRGPQDDTQHQ